MQVELSCETEDNATSRELWRILPQAGAGGFQVAGLITGKKKQNFTPLSFNWTGRELQSGSIFVLRFLLLTDYIGIYDSKYPKANNKVENSVMIGICG